MRVLFFTNTPAHVHLYRHPLERLREAGHETHILARDYGCTLDLLAYHDLPHTVYGTCPPAKLGLLLRLPGHYANIIRSVRRFDPDCIFGIGAYAAHGSIVSDARCMLVFDSEPTGFDHRISRPFADFLLTPSAFRKDLGSKHYVFDGFKESAYLHPAVFESDPSVRDELGVGPDDRFAIVRFNAFGSHHDVGHSGFPPTRRGELIEALSAHATVFVSDEADDFNASAHGARTFDLHPARLHDALAEASLLVADTQTMVTEAALLGTPAVRSNSFVGDDDMGNFIALESADLIINAADFNEALAAATDLLSSDTAARQWQQRSQAAVSEMTNLTELLVELALSRESIESHPGVSHRDDAMVL